MTGLGPLATWTQDSVFGLLLRESKAEGSALLLLSLLAGTLQGAAILLVAHMAQAFQGTTHGDLAGFALFVVLLLLFAAAKHLALHRGVLLTEQTTTQLVARLAASLRRTELAELERLGRERIYANITRDIKVFSNSAMLAVHTLQSMTVIAVVVGYLSVVSMPAFLLVITLAWLGMWQFTRSDRAMKACAEQANLAEDRFFELLDQALDGFKELKLDERKRRALVEEHMLPAAREAMNSRIAAAQDHVRKMGVFNWLYFPTLSIIAFVFPELGAPSITNSLLALLFLWTPIIDSLAAVPNLVTTRLSVQRIRAIETALEQVQVSLPRHQECPSRFHEIRLEGVLYDYTDKHGDTTFQVGPLDLTLRAGEITLIVGGNGSGKSTLLKLLTGLYPPRAGRVLLDGESPLIDDYRGLFSCVFTDFHLFRRLYGVGTIDPREVERLLHELRLADKTRVVEGSFADTSLSSGQRKRLALIAAYLEHRPVYMFDEWTADQDPEFRRYFYEVLLPELKGQGKTVVCVTHDDRYFHTADRLIRLQDGRIASIQPRTGAAP